jgi:AraC family transcriptional regulator
VILRGFPSVDLRHPEGRAFLGAYGRTSMVVHARAAEAAYARHAGPLSLKWAPVGRETYEVDGLAREVDAGHYLVLNAGTAYASAIDSDTEVESLSVFFQPGLAEQVLGALVTPEDRLLDAGPEASGAGPVRFLERLQPSDGWVSPRLARLRAGLLAGAREGTWLDEQLHGLLEALVQVHRGAHAEAARLPRVRPATRAELLRRLSRARDLIACGYREPLRLQTLARAAALAPHHFLRAFGEAFGETPHQALTRRRLAAACALLAEGRLPVGAVALEVGFHSHSAFSRLFRAHTGLSPAAWAAAQARR